MCVQQPRMRLSQYHCSRVRRIPVTGMALRWLLLGSGRRSLDAEWDFFFMGTRGRGARDEPAIGGVTAIPVEIQKGL